MYDFAFRGRWLVGHVVVAALAGLFILAGFWQLDRLHQVRAQNDLIRARRQLPVVSLGELIEPTASSAGQAEQRRVEVSGRYDSRHEAIVFHSLNGQTGFDVLAPLVLDDATAVIVDRGWIPGEPTLDVVPSNAAPPPGNVRVTGLAQSGVPGGSITSGSLGAVRLNRIDLDLLQRQVPYDLFPVYVRLQTQSPAQASGSPKPVPPPPLDNGPHLSYAIQWFSFTAIGLIGWPLLLRRSVRERAT